MADVDKFIYYENGSKKVLKPTDRMVIGSGGLAFEGSTNNDFETEFIVLTQQLTGRSKFQMKMEKLLYFKVILYLKRSLFL